MSFWRQPLDKDRIRITYGIVHVIVERCKGCGFCIEFCPRGLLTRSEEANSKGYYPPQVNDDVDCTNCGLCELLCPDFAIFVEAGEERSPEKVVPIQTDGGRP
jgi:2-oxoglutarate ferredoxin oxidoreductase subunit delta